MSGPTANTKAFGTPGELPRTRWCCPSYDRGMSPAVRRLGPIMINRVQALVLAFFLMAWISLIAILVAAPEVYERRLRSLPGAQRMA